MNYVLVIMNFNKKNSLYKCIDLGFDWENAAEVAQIALEKTDNYFTIDEIENTMVNPTELVLDNGFMAYLGKVEIMEGFFGGHNQATEVAKLKSEVEGNNDVLS